MRQFSQPVLMPCTYKEFKADLQQPLKEMGIKCSIHRKPFTHHDLTIYAGYNKTLCDSILEKTYRIPTYNPKLFLAIAAMCSDDPTKILPGRYFKCVKGFKANVGRFNEGDLCNKFHTEDGNVVPEFWLPAALEDLVEAFGHVAEGKCKPSSPLDIGPCILRKTGLEILAYSQGNAFLSKLEPLSMEEVEKKVAEWRESNKEIYDGGLHKVTIKPYMKDGRMQFDEPRNWRDLKPFDAEITRREINTQFQAAKLMQEMLPKKVDNPLPGKNYLFHLIHDEFQEGYYVGKAENSQYVLEVNGLSHKADTLYEMPAKKEYTEEDMENAYKAGRINARSLPNEAYSEDRFNRTLKRIRDGKTT